MRTALLMVLVAAAAATVAPTGSATAEEPASGTILVHVHNGPGISADPVIRLFRDGATTDVWSTYCRPSTTPGYTSCDGLPSGRYTFGVGGVPDGVVVAPSCTFQSVNGEFYPVNVGSGDTPEGPWDWAWNCELFVGRPGVVVHPAIDLFPAPEVEIAGAEATCSTTELHEGSTVTWCTATTPGEWTIRPPAEAAGWTVTSKCEPIGTYLEAGYPLETFTFTNTTEDPVWRCGLEYRQDRLVWYVVAEPGTPDAAFADAPWRVVAAETGEDVSARCTESDPSELGAIVAYTCDVPTGRYSVEIDGFAPEFGASACTDVFVEDVTYCSALEVRPTSASYALSTWAAPDETWPAGVTLELVGPAGAPPPACRTITDQVLAETATAVGRERWGECVQLVPGAYSYVVTGAPAGATVELPDPGCDGFELAPGGSWHCSVVVRTVEVPEIPGTDQPSSTLPPTGAPLGRGMPAAGAAALALGAVLLVAAQRRGCARSAAERSPIPPPTTAPGAGTTSPRR